MRTLVIGDIHGGLKGLKQLLERAMVKENDRLVFLGDYVDGWSESAQVIEYLMVLSQLKACVFIKGNHDAWCEKWLRTDKPDKVWLEHGGRGAIESYKGFSKDEKKAHLKFFEQMKLYYVDDQNRLFVHGGFTSRKGVENENLESNFYFDRTLWERALHLDQDIDENSELFPKRLRRYKEIYIGHTPTIYFDSEQPLHAINVWNVDTGAAFYGKLSAMDIDSKAVFQSDALMELYPNEKGRNQRSLNQILGA
ncbi:metallophosphoesterase family protein [Gelidibacter maritimus]|uniref:Serine/threonine protein phosphatase n=1 Tax=Gelidibacter maritimus TaxID=2761487 RepID=A0A7W2M6C2_9FLAO|nr:metallophosphoesterase family protein [Gelidibacter maritimus]MBA6153510.1 serine/threonine protein phosphatase [Gelidibacter maritimus]